MKVKRRWIWGTAYGFVSAAISTGWLMFLGSSDYEEQPTFGYLFGDEAPGALTSQIESGFGRVEFIGVPVFDFRQLLGVRLPIAGSWIQSPMIFFRDVISESTFYLLRTFLPLLVMLLVLHHVIEVLCGRGKYGWRVIVISICAVGHIGMFSRATDWSVAAGFNSALVTLSCTIICSTLEDSRGKKSMSRWIPPAAVYSTIEIATGHPGWLFYAVLMVSSVWIAAHRTLITGNIQRGARISRHTLWLLAIVAFTIVANATVTFLDLVQAFQGVPKSSEAQGMSGLGDPLNILSGFTRGILPGWIERFASQIVFGAFAPFLWIGFSVNGELTILQYSANLFPRGWFPLLTALVALIAARAQRPSHSSRTLVARIFIMPSVVMIAYVFLQEWGLLISVLKTSGTWIPGSSLRIFLVLGLLATFSSSRIESSWVLRAISTMSITMAVLYSTIMMGILTVPGANRDLSHLSEQAASPVGPPSNEIGKFVSPGGRIIAARGDDPSSSALLFLELRDAGYQVVAPASVKNRTVSPIANLPATNGLFVPTPAELEYSMLQNRGRTIDFLNVEAVFIAQDSIRSESEMRLGLQSVDNVIVSAGTRYQSLLNGTYSTFHIESRESEFSRPCSLLQDRCDPLAEADQGPTRSTPRFQLCRTSCLATFDFDVATAQAETTILLPVGFDPTIEARYGDSSMKLDVQNVAGMLGVRVSNASSGTIRLAIQPDSLMLGRSLLAYLNTLLLFCSFLFAIPRVLLRRILSRGELR